MLTLAVCVLAKVSADDHAAAEAAHRYADALIGYVERASIAEHTASHQGRVAAEQSRFAF